MTINDPVGMISLVSDAALLVMLGTVSYQCVRAARRSASLREDKAEMAALLDKVGQQVGDASSRLQELNRLSAEVLPTLVDAVERAERLSPELKLVTESGERIADRIEGMAQDGRKTQSQIAALLDIWEERQGFWKELLSRTESAALASSAAQPSASQTVPAKPIARTDEEREVAALVSEALASISHADESGNSPAKSPPAPASATSEGAPLNVTEVASKDLAPASEKDFVTSASILAEENREQTEPAGKDNSRLTASNTGNDGLARDLRAEPALQAVGSASQAGSGPRKSADDLLNLIRRI